MAASAAGSVPVVSVGSLSTHHHVGGQSQPISMAPSQSWPQDISCRHQEALVLRCAHLPKSGFSACYLSLPRQPLSSPGPSLCHAQGFSSAPVTSQAVKISAVIYTELELGKTAMRLLQ